MVALVDYPQRGSNWSGYRQGLVGCRDFDVDCLAGVYLCSRFFGTQPFEISGCAEFIDCRGRYVPHVGATHGALAAVDSGQCAVYVFIFCRWAPTHCGSIPGVHPAGDLGLAELVAQGVGLAELVA